MINNTRVVILTVDYAIIINAQDGILENDIFKANWEILTINTHYAAIEEKCPTIQRKEII